MDLHHSIPVNVLVVDDRAENRVALAAILASTACHCVEASSSDEALHKLLHEEFAVLLLDVVMPDCNGFELATLIRARERTAMVPIVFITAQAIDVGLEGYRAGAVDYLVKPLVPEIVRAKVEVFAQLYRQRKVIEDALQEKEVLLREVHHRVKNNLQVVSSLLNLQGSLQPPAIRNMFLDSEARVRSIALVHERLYQADNFDSIDVDDYLQSLVSELLHTYESIDTKITVNGNALRFPLDIAIPCGLIVNELVSNALKHAFPGGRSGRVSVVVVDTDGGLELEVSDDGVGIPKSIDPPHVRTMGLQVVHNLSEQLGGVIDIDRSEGTRFRVRFPKPEPRGRAQSCRGR